jgi:hypothetical protein
MSDTQGEQAGPLVPLPAADLGARQAQPDTEVKVHDTVLLRLGPQCEITYVDPDLLASCKEWLRHSHNNGP